MKNNYLLRVIKQVIFLDKIKNIPNFDKRKSFNAFKEEKTKNDIYPSFKLI